MKTQQFGRVAGEQAGPEAIRWVITFAGSLLATLLSSAALAGGWTSQGANLNRPVSVNERIVMKTVDQVAPFLPHFFAALEGSGELSRPLKLKLFKGTTGLSVYGVIRRMKFEPEWRNACYEEVAKTELGTQEEEGGTVRNPTDFAVKAPLVICVSLQRLAPKVAEHDRVSRIFAGIAHDVAHLAGAGEAEAKLIESLALKAEITQRSKYDWETDSEELSREVERLVSRLSRIQGDVERRVKAGQSGVDICAARILDFEGTLDVGRFFELKAGSVRPDSSNRLMGLVGKAMMLAYACTVVDENAKAKLDDMFRGRTEVPSSAFSFGIAGHVPQSPGTDAIKLRYPRYGDVDFLRAELRATKQVALELIGELKLAQSDMENAVYRPLKAWVGDLLRELEARGETRVAGFAIGDLRRALDGTTFELENFDFSKDDGSTVRIDGHKVQIDSGVWSVYSHRRRVELVLTGLLRVMKVSGDEAAAGQIIEELRQKLGNPLDDF